MVFRLAVALPVLTALTAYGDDFDRPPINYASARPDNVITRLQKRLDGGEVRLAFTDDHGYLPAILKELKVPVSSQTLVFSKTSFRRKKKKKKKPIAGPGSRVSGVGAVREQPLYDGPHGRRSWSCSCEAGRPGRAPGPGRGRGERAEVLVQGLATAAVGTSAMPQLVMHQREVEVERSSDWWAIRGSRPVPSYIRVSHWRQIVPSGVAIQPSSTQVSVRAPPARPASGWSRRTTMLRALSWPTEARVRWSGTERTSPQLRTSPDVALTGRHEVDVLQGSRRARSRGPGARRAAPRPPRSTHRRGEGDQPQVAGHRAGLAAQPRLDLLQVGEQPGAGVDQVPAVAGYITPRPTCSSSGMPTASSRLQPGRRPRWA